MTDLERNQTEAADSMININDIDITKDTYDFLLMKLGSKENIVSAIETGQLVEEMIDEDDIILYKDAEIEQLVWAVDNAGEEVIPYLVKTQIFDKWSGGRGDLLVDESAIALLDLVDILSVIPYKYDDYEFYKNKDNEIEQCVKIYVVTEEYIKKAGKNQNLYKDEVVLEIKNYKENKSQYIAIALDTEDLYEKAINGCSINNRSPLEETLWEYDLQIYDVERLEYELEREVEYLKSIS